MKNLATAITMTILAAALPLTAYADAKDDLATILTEQFANWESVIDEYLGWNQMEEAFEEEGFTASLGISITKELAASLGIREYLPGATELTLGFAVDPDEKVWEVSLAAAVDSEEIVSAVLTGSEELLALSVPQFSSSAVGIRSGYLLEQYYASALYELVGEDLPLYQDVYLTFYSTEEDEGVTVASDKITDTVDAFLAAVAVTEEDGGYTCTIPTADALTFLRTIAEESLEGELISLTEIFGDAFDIDDVLDTEELLETFDETLEEMEPYLADTSTAVFEVENGEVHRMAYSVEVQNDGGVLMGELTITAEFDGGNASLALQVEDFGEEMVYAVSVVKEQETEDTCTTETLTLYMDSNGESTEWEMYTMIFDASTGSLDLTIKLDEDWCDADGFVCFVGNFVDVVPGESFGYTLNAVTAVVDGEAMAVASEGMLTVRVGVGAEVAVDEDVVMLLEAGETELTLLVMEIYMNAMSWASEYGELFEEIYSASDEIVVEEELATAEESVDEEELLTEEAVVAWEESVDEEEAVMEEAVVAWEESADEEEAVTEEEAAAWEESVDEEEAVTEEEAAAWEESAVEEDAEIVIILGDETAESEEEEEIVIGL